MKECTYVRRCVCVTLHVATVEWIWVAGSSLFGQTPAVNGNNGALLSTAGRLVLEAVASYRQDYRNIQNGAYKEPWDMQLGHRQFNPLFVLDKAQRFVSESVHVLGARDTNASTDVWNQDSKLYPKYFRHTFHYQKDGWFSQDSAKVYESSTETLFVGRQDAMQRGTLVPFAQFMKGAPHSPLFSTHHIPGPPCRRQRDALAFTSHTRRPPSGGCSGPQAGFGVRLAVLCRAVSYLAAAALTSSLSCVHGWTDLHDMTTSDASLSYRFG